MSAGGRIPRGPWRKYLVQAHRPESGCASGRISHRQYSIRFDDTDLPDPDRRMGWLLLAGQILAGLVDRQGTRFDQHNHGPGDEESGLGLRIQLEALYRRLA